MVELLDSQEKFIKMLYDYTGGDVSRMVVGGELYPLAGRFGFNDDEVVSISVALDFLGYLWILKEKDRTGRDTISLVRLTPSGVTHVRNSGIV
jgi:hypothetical protein